MLTNNRAYVRYPNGRVRAVRNLGWVLRHWAGISRLEWESIKPREGYTRSGYGHTDGIFRAHMRDGSIYAICYASFDIWKHFVNRPVFRGLTCVVNGIEGTI